MKTMMMAMVGIALAGAAEAREPVAGTIAATGRSGINRDLGQRYCIVDPSMRTASLRRVCGSLGEWQVRGIDPRTMRRM